jgi:hypothetical protein
VGSTSRKARDTVIAFGIVGAGFSTLAISLLLLLLRDMGNTACPLPNSDSGNGEATWSWFPIGPRCRLPDGVHPPTWWLSVAFYGLLVADVALVAWWARRRSSGRDR